jgi:hypothetical protein
MVLFVITLTASTFASNRLLELTKTIGDDRDNYIFARLSGAALSPSKDIFVSDSKEHYIAKYTWEGKFVKKMGRIGQGPNDFYYPKHPNIFNKKLYILDSANFRIVRMDLELNNPDYQRLYDTNFMLNSLIVLADYNYIGSTTISPPNADGRVQVIDLKSKTGHSFFNEYPIKFGKSEQDIKKKSVLNFLAAPVIGIDDKKQKILVSFQYPGNPILFYLYSTDGILMKKFQYQLDDRFKFPVHNLTYPLKYPPESHTAVVDSIYYYKGHFLVFLVTFQKKREKVVNREYNCLFFDESGVLKGVYPTEIGLKVFYISHDGYLLGKNFDAEIEQLLIYKIKQPDPKE